MAVANIQIFRRRLFRKLQITFPGLMISLIIFLVNVNCTNLEDSKNSISFIDLIEMIHRHTL